MSTYFIGDVHGCYDELMTLIERLAFNPNKDKLIFVGDLINRGPKSVDVLRYIRQLGDSAQVVLGNHDLSYFAYALGVYHGRNTNFPEILAADKNGELLAWLRTQPLLIHDEALNVVVAHAGIPPRWSIEKAKKQARKAEKKLQSDDWKAYLRYAYKPNKDKWQDDYNKWDKFRYRLNGFSRLRFCDTDGEPDFRDKCAVGEQHSSLIAWFEARKTLQRDSDTRLIFGHWAALGFLDAGNAICIDSGCAWGGKLTAIEVTDEGIKRTQVLSYQKR